MMVKYGTKYITLVFLFEMMGSWLFSVYRRHSSIFFNSVSTQLRKIRGNNNYVPHFIFNLTNLPAIHFIIHWDKSILGKLN